jgi:hypothetical protein
MNEERPLTSSEVALRVVQTVLEQKRRDENRDWKGPDVSSKQSTPLIVWGAFFGLVVGAFSGGSHGFLAGLVSMFAGMAIGAGLVWGIGKAFSLFFRLLGVIFRGLKGSA